MSSVGCLIPPNADIAGIGVRIAVYVQNVLCFLPALWAIADEKITKYELDSMENMSLTNLLVAFGILISCFVQTPTLGLTSFHASIVLSMSWMNNTNVFIYFLLYAARLRNRDGSWVMHLRDHVVSALHLRRFFPPPALPTDEEGFKNHEKEQATPVAPAPASPEKIRLFRRVALVLGSLHLTLMSALGLWLWSDPRGFGTADSACTVDHAHLAIAGGSVAFGSRALRVFSLFIYGLFLMPGFNLLLPMALFLGIYLVHGKFYPEALQGDLDEPQPPSDTSQSTAKHVWSVAKRISSPKSPVFPAFIGLCFLLAINIIFIVDIELTLRSNGGIQEQGESEWGFGQVLAMLLLFLPLRDLVEMIFRRRQELKTQVNTEMKRAINRRDFEGISRWAIAGASPEVMGDDGQTALEVVCVTGHWDILHILVENGTDMNTLFKDGRTALEVAVYERGCKNVHIPVGLGASINTPLKDGQTALEVATRASDWKGVRILVGLGAGIDATFKDGQRALEVATRASHREGILTLVTLGADVNSVNKAGKTALEVATCASDLECLRTLFELGASINAIFSDGKTALEVASVAQDWDLLCFLVESGVDVNIMFTDGGTALEAVSFPHNWDALCTQRGMDVNTVLADDETVLEVAIRTQDWEGTHVLGKLGAKVSPMFKDTFGQAALMAAVDARDKKAVCALAVSGCVGIEDGQFELDVAINARNWEHVCFLLVLKASNGISFQGGSESMVLQLAAEEGQWDILPEIIDAGANVNMTVNGFHDTVLHLACESECQLAIIEHLLKNGADPNARGLRGRTALHRACWTGREDCVPLLLAHGADPHLQDNGGDTPLHDACRHGHIKCVELLLKHQPNLADPNTKSKNGRTPLHQAYLNDQEGCIKLLLANGADETIKDIFGEAPRRHARIW